MPPVLLAVLEKDAEPEVPVGDRSREAEFVAATEGIVAAAVDGEPELEYE